MFALGRLTPSKVKVTCVKEVGQRPHTPISAADLIVRGLPNS